MLYSLFGTVSIRVGHPKVSIRGGTSQVSVGGVGGGGGLRVEGAFESPKLDSALLTVPYSANS